MSGPCLGPRTDFDACAGLLTGASPRTPRYSRLRPPDGSRDARERRRIARLTAARVAFGEVGDRGAALGGRNVANRGAGGTPRRESGGTSRRESDARKLEPGPAEATIPVWVVAATSFSAPDIRELARGRSSSVRVPGAPGRVAAATRALSRRRRKASTGLRRSAVRSCATLCGWPCGRVAVWPCGSEAVRPRLRLWRWWRPLAASLLGGKEGAGECRNGES